MNFRIICYTLFNITYTGITARAKPDTDNIDMWIKSRNTQWNFDTIIQLISLRSQPDILGYPEQILGNKKYFGKQYEKEKNLICWKFTFAVQHGSVFDNEDIKLGNLYADCHNVPMLLIGNENKKLLSILDISEQFRNIYFSYE